MHRRHVAKAEYKNITPKYLGDSRETGTDKSEESIEL